MELKLLKLYYIANQILLLIVPYGIETTKMQPRSSYGKLLIVPYGIETQSATEAALAFGLLIVPYGIETNLRLCIPPRFAWAFNRTLWN